MSPEREAAGAGAFENESELVSVPIVVDVVIVVEAVVWPLAIGGKEGFEPDLEGARGIGADDVVRFGKVEIAEKDGEDESFGEGRGEGTAGETTTAAGHDAEGAREGSAGVDRRAVGIGVEDSVGVVVAREEETRVGAEDIKTLVGEGSESSLSPSGGESISGNRCFGRALSLSRESALAISASRTIRF